MKRCGLILAVFLALPLIAEAQLHPNLERGFSAEAVYDFGEIDSVNLFNGNLSLDLPLGVTYPVGGALSYRFTLVYNSNVWDFDERCIWDGLDQEICFNRAEPAAINNAGIGWRVSLGDLVAPWPMSSGDTWSFVTSDGASHRFWHKLHEDDPLDNDVMYTRDNSYLRMRVTGRDGNGDPIQRTVESGDGISYIFQLATAGWRLTRIQDTSGNFVQINYSQSDRWIVTDSAGRQHTIFFQTRSGYRVVDRLVLASFNSTTATYNLHYSDRTIARHCYDDDPETSDNLLVPLLTTVLLPDGGSIDLKRANGDLGYNTTNDGGPLPSPCTVPYSGTLTGLRLPTGGNYEWDYGSYAYPTGSGQCGYPGDPYYDVILGHSVGVTTKRSIVASQTAVWNYTRPTVVDSQATTLTTTVTSPEGDDTRHYFRVRVCQDSDWTGWDYGLPFTRDTMRDGYFLSVDYYEGAANGGNLKRRRYVYYEHDKLHARSPVFYASEDWYATNRRLRRGRTYYLDDGGSWTGTMYSLFDGMGHYRKVSNDGSWSGVSRTVLTGFNPSRGVYEVDPDSNEYTGNHNFTPWPVGDPWILGTFATRKASQGSQTAQTEYCFNQSNGLLLRRRVLKNNGTTRSSHDIITTYTYDSHGNVTAERNYGGDLKSVGTGELCWTGLGTLDYQLDKTYQYGVLSTSKHHGQPYYDVDRDIDKDTGLVKTERDTTGLATNLSYDTLGRLTARQPQEGAWTSVSYSYDPPEVQVTYIDPSDSSVLAEEELLFDGLGRPTSERRKMPGSRGLSEKLTDYTPEGLVAKVSEWAQLPAEREAPATLTWTVFHDYDRFGRPGSVEAPDGSVAVYTYEGVRIAKKTVSIGSNMAGQAVTEQQFTVTTEKDPWGHVSTVTEPVESGDNGASVTSTYDYDVAGRLVKVTVTPSSGGTSGETEPQVREYRYDNRGFLLWEDLPEKDPPQDGGHDVVYSDYDTLGHAHHMEEGDHALSYAYDAGERLTTVTEGSPPDKLVEQRTYDQTDSGGSGSAQGANRSLGKLVSLERHNYFAGNGPLRINGSDDFVVKEEYQYNGLGGRISSRKTTVSLNYQATFVQGFAWTELGALKNTDYPRRVGGTGWRNRGPRRLISYWYDQGFLTAVPGYASSISYHDGGMLSTVTHATRVILRGSPLMETRSQDPSGMARIASISAMESGATLWDSGSYSYDGAGNITGIGQDTFVYDGLSRLTKATLHNRFGWTFPRNYQYDGFGNLVSLGGRNLTVDAATNRLTAVDYSASGNQTSWGADNLTFEYAYYADNQLCKVGRPNLTSPVDQFVYGYTGDGERLATYEVIGGQFQGVRYTLRDLEGHVLREFVEKDDGASWTWTKDYIWGPSGLLATVSPTEGTKHYVNDHLGSPRLVYDRGGAEKARHTYWPFGEEFTAAGQDHERIKFTGHERDLNNGQWTTDDLDYMHARYYTFNLGRFMSVDPEGGSIGGSQSWNRYGYSHNNPLRLVDRFGLSPGDPEQGGDINGTTAGCDQDSPGGDQPCTNPQPETTASAGEGQLPQGEVAFWLWFGKRRYGPIQDSDSVISLNNQAQVYLQMATDEAHNGNEYMAYLLYGSKTAGDMYALQSRGTPADVLIFGFAGGLIRRVGTAAAFDMQQQALVALAKEAARKGVTEEEAGTLLQWAKEYGMAPALDHTSSEAAAHWIGGAHIRIGPVRHIPVR